MGKRPEHRPWPPQLGDGWPSPSPEEILAAKGPNGMWPHDVLREWGIPLVERDRGRLGPPERWREKMGAHYRRVQAANKPAHRPWPPEAGDGWPLPSPDEMLAAKGDTGYWPESKFAEWGIPQDPVPPRWREAMERAYWRENIPAEVYELLGPGYDEEGVRTAWLNPWRGMKRWRMFEMWWEDPDQVRRALTPKPTEIVLIHDDGAGRIEIKLPMDPTLTAAALEALGPLGWSPVGDISLLFAEDET